MLSECVAHNLYKNQLYTTTLFMHRAARFLFGWLHSGCLMSGVLFCSGRMQPFELGLCVLHSCSSSVGLSVCACVLLQPELTLCLGSKRRGCCSGEVGCSGLCPP